MRQQLFFSLWWVVGLALLGLAGCVEPYMPEVLTAPSTFLVVDGFINGNGVTRISLSRSTGVAATATPPVEKGAKLFIVDNTGSRYPLREQAPGAYRSDSLVLAAGRQYQLRITTAANAAYESALVPLKVTPPIEEIKPTFGSEQLQFSLSTHDASAQSRFYRWSFVETWEFTSRYESSLEYRNGIIDVRITPIHTCWRTERNTAIRQGSSAQLSQDALTDIKLLSFPIRAERVKIRYSVLVSQVAETAAEFAYYELLRKNTEAVGTVNDPLPTQLTGNVHRLDNASEPVLGFVGAHTVQQRRVFVSRADLPSLSDAQFESYFSNCTLQDVAEVLFPFSEYKYAPVYPKTVLFGDPDNVPTTLVYASDGVRVYGYAGSSRECVDCRVHGSNVKPSFW